MNKFSLSLFLLLTALPLLAQKRIVTDEKSSAGLAQSDAKNFTKKDKPRPTDNRGLMTSDYAGTRHLFGLWADGGYSGIMHNMETVSHRPGGYSAGLGVAYELQHNHFILQVGAGAVFQDVTYSCDGYRFTNADLAYNMWDRDTRWLPAGNGGQLIDTYGVPIDRLTYTATERKDVARTVYLQVPLLMGGTVGGFYGLAGAKVNIPLWGKTHMYQNITSEGLYNQYIGTHGEMDNHGYRYSVEISADGDRLPFRIDVLLSGEVGYEFRNGTQRYRIGAYVDYGLLNINPDGTAYPLYWTFENKWNFDRFELAHMFNSSLTEGKQLHNFFAGVKFTILFGTPEKDKCILCQQAKKSKR
ncbi:MAG: hypothetical protein MJZ75_00010 [Paludibacteraceae bacterium]|nr:hypothetical protein [Paludibacteraceae bacterium]